MKNFILLATALLFLQNVFSQEQKVKLKKPVVYQVETTGKDSLVISPSGIELEVAEWTFDSCNFYNNNFEFQFEIRNTTKQPVLCNRSINCWNDSGLTNSQYLQGEPLIIAPGKTEKVTVKVMPYQKRKMTTHTQFVVCQNDKNLLVPMQLKFACNSVKPCAKTNPVNSPAEN